MKSSKVVYGEESIYPGYFNCLKKQDVITAKVSDHHPVIHDGVLFWNIMMQGKLRNGRTGTKYNNGLAIIETDEDYINRLVKVGNVIAEIMHVHPSIDVINICEGPIQPVPIDIFLGVLKQYHSMNKFFIKSVVKDSFHKPHVNGFPNWGLFMLANQKYKVNEIKCDFLHHSGIFNKLANRFQIWELENDMGKCKYIGLAHFPFGGDEYIAEKYNLSHDGKIYCQLVRDLINDYSDEEFILSADFNLNPYLISEFNDRALDRIANNNSILFSAEETFDAVTVDGVLLSRLEKQKFYSSGFHFGLFTKLATEDSFVKASINENVIQNRHNNSHSQTAYDKLFGLVPR